MSRMEVGVVKNGGTGSCNDQIVRQPSEACTGTRRGPVRRRTDPSHRPPSHFFLLHWRASSLNTYWPVGLPLLHGRSSPFSYASIPLDESRAGLLPLMADTSSFASIYHVRQVTLGHRPILDGHCHRDSRAKGTKISFPTTCINARPESGTRDR